jgi:electron transfer flavoprotein alpha subunit
MSTCVIAIAEFENGVLTTAALECFQEARQIADTMGVPLKVVYIGSDLGSLLKGSFNNLADQVIQIEHEQLRLFSADGWAQVMTDFLREADSGLVLAPDSSHSRAWMPRVAFRLGFQLLTGCIQFEVQDQGGLMVTRPIYSGMLQEKTISEAGTPLLATLLPGARGLTPSSAAKEIDVVQPEFDISGTPLRDRTIQYILPDPRTVDIREADLIVAAGLGTDGMEGVELVQQLAICLGASVGATRPVVDRGWLPIEREIGVTGKTVKPKLYIAIGISGATQHTMGMAQSEDIIAINIDPTAPIFNLGDINVVGDLHQVIPEMLKGLNQILADSSPEEGKAL